MNEAIVTIFTPDKFFLQHFYVWTKSRVYIETATCFRTLYKHTFRNDKLAGTAWESHGCVTATRFLKLAEGKTGRRFSSRRIDGNISKWAWSCDSWALDPLMIENLRCGLVWAMKDGAFLCGNGLRSILTVCGWCAIELIALRLCIFFLNIVLLKDKVFL